MDYETILNNYSKGLWPAYLVRLAVKKGVITQQQCAEILASKR